MPIVGSTLIRTHSLRRKNSSLSYSNCVLPDVAVSVNPMTCPPSQLSWALSCEGTVGVTLPLSPCVEAWEGTRHVCGPDTDIKGKEFDLVPMRRVRTCRRIHTVTVISQRITYCIESNHSIALIS